MSKFFSSTDKPFEEYQISKTAKGKKNNKRSKIAVLLLKFGAFFWDTIRNTYGVLGKNIGKALRITRSLFGRPEKNIAQLFEEHRIKHKVNHAFHKNMIIQF